MHRRDAPQAQPVDQQQQQHGRHQHGGGDVQAPKVIGHEERQERRKLADSLHGKRVRTVLMKKAEDVPGKGPRILSRAGRNFHGNWFFCESAQMVAEYLELHPVDPQPRLIRQAAEIVRRGGLIAYPTDSCYALGLAPGRQGCTGARAAHPPGRPAPSFHAGVRQPRRGRALRAPGNLAVPHAARLPARAVHVPAAGHARDAAPPAAREAPHHRRAHPGPPGAAPAAGGAAASRS